MPNQQHPPGAPSPTSSPPAAADQSSFSPLSSTSTLTSASTSTSTSTLASPPKYHGTHPILHNAALAVSALGLLALLLPPRRADARGAVLSGITFLGTNQLAYDYTGRSISERFGSRVQAASSWMDDIPEGAKRARDAIRLERERQQRRQQQQQQKQQQQQLLVEEGEEEEEQQQRKKKQEQQQHFSSASDNNNEASEKKAAATAEQKTDWRREWDEKEQKALAQGKGYGSLISDAIREVAGWGGGGGGGVGGKGGNGGGSPGKEKGGDDGKKP